MIKRDGGTTPKFDCERPGNDVIRVKYGRGNPELHAEIAATRLLSALGFGADRMFVVKSVRCAGCPAFPFQALKCFAETGMQIPCFAGGVDYSTTTDFDFVSIERRLEGRRIESTPDQGWAFYEIDRIDERAGGSPQGSCRRAEAARGRSSRIGTTRQRTSASSACRAATGPTGAVRGRWRSCRISARRSGRTSWTCTTGAADRCGATPAGAASR